MENEILKRAADSIPTAVTCRFLKVSTSGKYEWVSRPLPARAVADETLTVTIRAGHRDFRETYGAPRVLAELWLGRRSRWGKSVSPA